MEVMLERSEIKGNITGRDKPDEEYYMYKDITFESVLSENKNNPKKELSAAQKLSLTAKSNLAKTNVTKKLNRYLRINSFLTKKHTVAIAIGLSLLSSVFMEFLISTSQNNFEISYFITGVILGAITLSICCWLGIKIERRYKLMLNSSKKERKVNKAMNAIINKLEKVDGYEYGTLSVNIDRESKDQYFGDDTYYEVKLDSLKRSNL